MREREGGGSGMKEDEIGERAGRRESNGCEGGMRMGMVGRETTCECGAGVCMGNRLVALGWVIGREVGVEGGCRESCRINGTLETSVDRWKVRVRDEN